MSEGIGICKRCPGWHNQHMMWKAKEGRECLLCWWWDGTLDTSLGT